MKHWQAGWMTIGWLLLTGVDLGMLQSSWVPVQAQVNDPSQSSDDQTLNRLVQQVAAARKKGDRPTELQLIYQLMAAAHSAGAVKLDLEASERYVALLQELNRPGEQVMALAILAGKYRSLGRDQEEMGVLQELLALGQGQQDQAVIAQALMLTGVLYRRQNKFSESIATLQQALSVAQTVKDRPDSEWQVRTFLALSYELSGDLERAVQVNTQNLAFARDRNLQSTYPRSYEAASLNTLSRVYFLQRQYPKAIATMQESIALLPQEPIARLGLAQSLEDLGFMQFRAGELAAAEATLREAIAAYDTARTERLRLYAQIGQRTQQMRLNEAEFGIDVYRVLQQVLVAQNKPNEALLAAEAGRARDLVSSLTEQPPAPPTLDQLRDIARTEQSTLVQYSVIYDDTRHYQVRFGWNRAIKPAATTLYVWVIEPNGQITFRQVALNRKQSVPVPSSSLETLVAEARESIGVGGRGLVFQEDTTRTNLESVTSALAPEQFRQLYDLLIQPIADLLPSDPEARIVFVPQDFLFLVPFPALQDAVGKYLIQQHTVLTAPSIQVLGLTRQLAQRSRSSQGALVVGNPTMPNVRPRLDADPQQLASLPGAEVEARAIATLLKTQMLTGKQATKAAVLQRMAQAKIIHLATHGLLEDLGGFQSSLALAPSARDQGLLTAEEIGQLKLNADLVVLSACDTGRGKINGDGVVGLSRAFIAAGVPSVIVSLWQVPDAPTAELMTEFYKSWPQQPDKAKALRQAMLATMQQNPDPRNWAAFTLIGVAH